MEGSKTFSKDFMARHNIPTAKYKNFNDYEAAKKYLDSVSHSVVLKASGLAAGKGVIIPATKDEAQDALKKIMLVKEFGTAGNEVVIEEFLGGEELSFLTFSDGYTIRSLPPAQDHKQIHDGDQGPNTGGMGCYAPTRIASKRLIDDVHRTILQPTVDGMRKEGWRSMTYKADLMLTICRLSFRRHPLYRPHDHQVWAKDPRIQCPLRRSRDSDSAATDEIRLRSGRDYGSMHRALARCN